MKKKYISKEVSFHRDRRILFVEQNDEDENNGKKEKRKTKGIGK